MLRPPPPFDRAVALACSLHTFRDRWIQVCCCAGEAGIPLKMLGADDPQRSRRTLADVVIRLRCTRCGQKPAAVHLVEDPAKGAHISGPGPGWHILLIGEYPPEWQEVERLAEAEAIAMRSPPSGKP